MTKKYRYYMYENKAMTCGEKFWITDVKNLFCQPWLIPTKGMTIGESLNALTRLTILIFIGWFIISKVILGPALFLIGAMVLLIIFYFTKKAVMKTKEHYISPAQQRIPDGRAVTVPNRYGYEDILIERPTARVWCNDEVPFASENPNNISVIPNQLDRSGTYLRSNQSQAGNTPVSTWTSMNQRLAGPPNPKTLIPPVIVPPIAELDFWRDSNLVTHSHINDQKSSDDYLSGYVVSAQCVKPEGSKNYVENQPVLYSNSRTQRKPGYKGGNRYSTNANDVGDYTERKETFQKSKSEGFRGDNDLELPFEIRPAQPGQVDTGCGYNPRQLYEANLPTNYPSTECQRSRDMADYNLDLYTQTLQPGVYSRNQVNEPVNSNLGISFTQQLEPVTIRESDDGNEVMFTRHDPRIMGEIIEEPEEEIPGPANVYDPRLNGYSSSARAYPNDLLGRVDYFYDDINSVRQPNYIVRSKVDIYKPADMYGPAQTEAGCPYTADIHGIMNNQEMKSTLEFRTGMSESYMRKFGAGTMGQRRAMPLNLMMR